MRKIISKHTENKRKKRNALIIGMILIFIMFFSVIGYSFRGREDNGVKKIDYNGFEFTKQNDFWFTEIGNFQFVFKYNPNEIERIDSKLKYLENYYEKPLYISSENKDAELEIYRNLDPRFNQIVQRIQPACLDGENCTGDLPVKTCEDNFIIIKESNVSRIIQEENCVFIEGKQENLIKLADEFLFKLLGAE